MYYYPAALKQTSGKRSGTADAMPDPMPDGPACRGRDGSGCGFGATRQVNYTKKNLKDGHRPRSDKSTTRKEPAQALGFARSAHKQGTTAESETPRRVCQCSPACCELRTNFLNPTIRESAVHAENFKLKDVRGTPQLRGSRRDFVAEACRHGAGASRSRCSYQYQWPPGLT